MKIDLEGTKGMKINFDFSSTSSFLRDRFSEENETNKIKYK